MVAGAVCGLLRPTSMCQEKVVDSRSPQNEDSSGSRIPNSRGIADLSIHRKVKCLTNPH